MRGEHIAVLGVEDGCLDRLAEHDLGMLGNVGVERVIARDEQGECRLTASAGAADLLPERGTGARPACGDDSVEAGDVDAELKRVRRGHRRDRAIAQLGLEGSTLLGQVAGSIGRYARDKRWVDLAEEVAGHHGDGLGATPTANEGEALQALDDEVGEEVGCLGGRGSAGNGRLAITS